ncbi:MAG TPA: hypothetical protein VHO25_17435 [Polyangiaceae bacterium]|nr:hypothetical protein [Polyangiaceae bacterium]
MRKLFKFVPLATTAALALFALTASAATSTTTQIRTIRVYADDANSRVDIRFWDDVAGGSSSCASKDWISLDSSYVTSTERREAVRQVAVSAYLSGRDVLVYTYDTCLNNKVKLSYIELVQ